MEESDIDEVMLDCGEEQEVLVESSSEDENEHLISDRNSVNDPPLYVLSPSNDMYRSEITQSKHTLALSAFSTRHNLSDAAVKDLLRLVQLHLPKNNVAETNITELKEKCGFNKNYITCKLYCDSCKKVYLNDTENCQTPRCEGVKTDSNSCKYFITSDLKTQMKEILERKGMWEAITLSKDANVTDTINDVTNGLAYKKLQEEGQFLHNSSNVTLSMFTDGIPLFKSSGVSLWPVYFLINEIPAKERFLRKNMLLWGVWQGNGKPKMNMFLHPLVLDLLELYNNGISIVVGSKTICVKAMVAVITMDLQARAYVTNMTQHNGEYGCLYCEEPGVVVESGKGRCRSYPYREVPSKLRKEDELRKNATEAQENGNRIKGFFGKSILSYLPYLSLTDSVVIDYMHGTLLGITKKLLHFWFDPENKAMPFYIGNHTAKVDKILRCIQPPYKIHRMPRVITNTFMHWKASELRNWLLFYSLPCLLNFLPELYLKHFCCLIEATYILLSQGITSLDLENADRLYKFFVQQASSLYGNNVLSLNMHNLTHTVDCVRKWGPLWAWSCFAYESFNGEIKQGVHGTGNVCRQIFWAFQAQKRICHTMQSFDQMKGQFKEFMEDMLDSNDKKIGHDAYQCKVVKVTDVKERFERQIHLTLKDMINFDNDFEFSNVSKIVRNGFLMYCLNCSKNKKQNSYKIALENKTPLGDIAIEVQRYVFHRETGRVFAIGKLITAGGLALGQRVPHLQIMNIKNEVSVVRAQDLKEPLFVIKSDTQVYGALFPNHFERD